MLRDLALIELQRQFAVPPITQVALDGMVAWRLASEYTPAQIEQFKNSIQVGKTRLVFFLLDNGEGLVQVMKIPATSPEEALVELEKHGTIQQCINGLYPRVVRVKAK